MRHGGTENYLPPYLSASYVYAVERSCKKRLKLRNYLKEGMEKICAKVGQESYRHSEFFPFTPLRTYEPEQEPKAAK